MNLKINKKAISPVVAMALLLVVAVVAVVGFQGWFSDFSSSTFVDVEQKSNSGFGSTSIELLEGNYLYIKNSQNSSVNISNINIGGINCNISSIYSGYIIKLDVSACIENLTTSTPDIVVITNSQILEEQAYVESVVSLASCNLDSFNFNSGSSATFYNSSLGSTCHSESRSCNDGTISGTSSFNQSSCTILSSSLTCITDLDGDGHINATCAKYPMTNTTYEGDLDVNDNNLSIKPDMSCFLSDDMSQCENNFIVDGCGSGTVMDLGTNLCWQRDFSTAGTMSWGQAKTYCNALSLGGNSDWKLPSKQELISITDLSRSSPAIVGGNDNKFTNVLNSYYWSISTYGPTTTSAWGVGFNDGRGNDGGKTGSYYVACVRLGY
jgi:hypothetical protein